MDNLSCNVCGQPAIGVASSAFGPISFAYCETCIHKPADTRFMFEYLYDEVSTDGEGLRTDINDWHTFIDGQYMSWPQFVEWRKAHGRGKSMPCEIPPPPEDEIISDDDFEEVWPPQED